MVRVMLLPRVSRGADLADGCAGLKFENTYSWCVRFDEHSTIVEVRAYLDSWMVERAIVENETPNSRAPLPAMP